MLMKTRIETKLNEAFSPTALSVKDESHLHVSHGNFYANGGSHFRVLIVSPLFRGCSRIERHQKVYLCLEKELKEGVHALCLKTLCPEEAESNELV